MNWYFKSQSIGLISTVFSFHVLLRGDFRLIRVRGGGDARSEYLSPAVSGFVLAKAFNAVNHRALFEILLA